MALSLLILIILTLRPVQGQIDAEVFNYMIDPLAPTRYIHRMQDYMPSSDGRRVFFFTIGHNNSILLVYFDKASHTVYVPKNCAPGTLFNFDGVLIKRNF